MADKDLAEVSTGNEVKTLVLVGLGNKEGLPLGEVTGEMISDRRVSVRVAVFVRVLELIPFIMIEVSRDQDWDVIEVGRRTTLGARVITKVGEGEMFSDVETTSETLGSML